MYGAGNIGRGFIGQIFHDSGYEVVFIDINQAVISALNQRNGYAQIVVDGEAARRREITCVRAVDGRDRDAVAREIAACGIMAVSVGAAVLPHIAPLLAAGLACREQPLNILVCENLIHAPAVLKGYVTEHLGDLSILENAGFVGATIGRMVPVMTDADKAGNPLRVFVEPYDSLPVDANAFRGQLPEVPQLLPYAPFCPIWIYSGAVCSNTSAAAPLSFSTIAYGPFSRVTLPKSMNPLLMLPVQRTEPPYAVPLSFAL